LVGLLRLAALLLRAFDLLALFANFPSPTSRQYRNANARHGKLANYALIRAASV
jgi:hypothetical protein